MPVSGGHKLRAALRKARAAQAAGGVKQLDVGFFDTARYQDGTPVASVAAWNEFGTKTAPERPFMRAAMLGARREVKPVIMAGVDPLALTMDKKTASQVGEVVEGRIQKSITLLRYPANAPETLKRKAPKDNPLIVTGKMRAAVSYQTR